jgi:hypothetical protein
MYTPYSPSSRTNISPPPPSTLTPKREKTKTNATTHVLQALERHARGDGDDEVVARHARGELPEDLGDHVGLDGQDDHLRVLWVWGVVGFKGV